MEFSWRYDEQKACGTWLLTLRFVVARINVQYSLGCKHYPPCALEVLFSISIDFCLLYKIASRLWKITVENIGIRSISPHHVANITPYCYLPCLLRLSGLLQLWSHLRCCWLENDVHSSSNALKQPIRGALLNYFMFDISAFFSQLWVHGSLTHLFSYTSACAVDNGTVNIWLPSWPWSSGSNRSLPCSFTRTSHQV